MTLQLVPRIPGPYNARVNIMSGRQSGFTLVELMTVFAIIGIIMALGIREYQRYLIRAKAAVVVVDSQPILRAIEEHQSTIDKNQYRLELLNGADGSIAGCQAPIGSTCAVAGAAAVAIVKPEMLLIAKGTVRVSAAPCYVDCPGFALNFSSDVTQVPASPGAPSSSGSPTAPTSPAVPPSSTAPTGPAAPATPTAPASPAPGTGKGGGKGGGKGKQGAWEAWPERRLLSSLGVLLVPSAHAATVAAAATGSTTQTNQVLYEFGEVMRKRAYAADNAACLFSTGTCTVTIKY